MTQPQSTPESDSPQDELAALRAEVVALREALKGADWIIGKLAPHEVMAVTVRGWRVPEEDVATGARYRAMIDAALAQPSPVAERIAAVVKAAREVYRLQREWQAIVRPIEAEGRKWTAGEALSMRAAIVPYQLAEQSLTDAVEDLAALGGP